MVLKARKTILTLASSLVCMNLFANYTIVVNEFDSSGGGGTELKNSLSSLGYSPLKIIENENKQLVIAGNYRYEIDAYLDSVYLKEQGMLGKVISTAENTNIPLSFPNKKSPLTPPDEFPELTLSQMGSVDKEIRKTTGTQAKISAVKFKLASLDQDDPLRGYCTLRLGYLYTHLKERNLADQYFSEIVESKVPSSENTYYDAVNRLARTAHAKNDRVKAYHLFKYLTEHAPNPKLKEESSVQLIGIMFELVRSAKGNFDDVRTQIGEYLNSGNIKTPQNIALLKLMHGESYYYQEQYEAAFSDLKACVDFLESQYSNLNREIGMASLFAAMSAKELGNYDLARSYFIKSCTLPYKDGVAWRHIPNMKKHASLLFKRTALENGREEDVALAEGYLK